MSSCACRRLCRGHPSGAGALALRDGGRVRWSVWAIVRSSGASWWSAANDEWPHCCCLVEDGAGRSCQVSTGERERRAPERWSAEQSTAIEERAANQRSRSIAVPERSVRERCDSLSSPRSLALGAVGDAVQDTSARGVDCRAKRQKTVRNATVWTCTAESSQTTWGTQRKRRAAHPEPSQVAKRSARKEMTRSGVSSTRHGPSARQLSTYIPLLTSPHSESPRRTP